MIKARSYAATPMLAAHNVCKRFGDHEVLQDVSLAVHAGEVAAILGPSGGGKSTLLRCLNGLEALDRGEVRVAGVTLSAELAPRERERRLLQARRKVGMVFQQFQLFPHRSVLGNVIEAPLHVLKISRDEAIADARRLLARVGMDHKLNQSPGTLSGGEQQRVAIARALAMRPEVLLFDEPTSSLDARMAAEVETVIADLAQSGQTMLLVTHDLAFARRASHSAYFFEGGKIAASGPTEEVCKGLAD